MNVVSRGTFHHLQGGQKLITAYLDGTKVEQMLCSKGSSTEAAYVAVEAAIRSAKAVGAERVTIITTSRHVVFQILGYWKARKSATRLMRDRCRRLCRGLDVTFQF